MKPIQYGNANSNKRDYCRKCIRKKNLLLTAPICACCVIPLAIRNGPFTVFLAVSERIREIRLCMEIVVMIHIAILEL